MRNPEGESKVEQLSTIATSIKDMINNYSDESVLTGKSRKPQFFNGILMSLEFEESISNKAICEYIPGRIRTQKTLQDFSEDFDYITLLKICNERNNVLLKKETNPVYKSTTNVIKKIFIKFFT